MRYPVEWLKEYVPIGPSLQALADRLTLAGLEVTGIESAAGETVLEIEITPNRADCLSMIGLAREIAVLTNQRVKMPSGSGAAARGARKRAPAHVQRASVRIEDTKACPRYVGRLIDDVRIGPSPAWMQKRLQACGIRPINNIVDITNYVLLEFGQPLHAFDFDKLAKSLVVVRRATSGEKLALLDGTTRPLSTDMLVIADGEKAVAVAGIMGGQDSAVSPGTRSMFLESALFDPVLVRRTGRALGLATESSYRFERGVDPQGVDAASMRAAALILEHAGGEELAVFEAGGKTTTRTGIVLDPARASRWIGKSYSPTAVRTTLARLGCQVAASSAGGSMHVGIPSYRRDLTQDVDLFEELVRVDGYDQLPSTVPSVPITVPVSDDTSRYQRLQSVRCLAASLGLFEAVTWSLLSDQDMTRCGLTDAVRVANPLSQDHAVMRSSLLPGLLQAARRNLTQGASGVRFFEVGTILRRRIESQALGLILGGVWSRDWRAQEQADFVRLKGLLHGVVSRLCEGELALKAAAQPWAAPGAGLSITVGGRAVGAAGQVAPAIAHALDIERELWYAEVSIEEMLAARRRAGEVQAPPAFPPVKRDLSVVVGQDVPFADLQEAVRQAAGAWAWRIELIDRFTGKQVPSGKYSVTFSIEYRDPARTLTAAEVDAVHKGVVDALARRFGAALR
jgi:phenylalanyl-tRNA synthetase beta chain